MSRTFEQFVRFTNDAAGLERTLRLFQSIAQILTSYTLPLHYLLHLQQTLTGTPTPAKTATAVLLALRSHIGLARRYFRLFKFLESFHAAQTLYASPGLSAAVWLDVLSRTFNGMYLLLEASTTLDALGIDGLAPWGPALDRAVNVEAQRFWLFALAFGALGGLVRIFAVFASAGEKGAVSKEGKETGKGKGTVSDGKDGAASDARTVVWTPAVRSKVFGLGRGVVANVLDITLPGTVVGWVPASSGVVGLAMFVTTLLTGFDVWERCGREVRK
ncbi:peroxisomal biogenesis factor 11 [Xylaria intraflava]|nr:peroxisomal biogenesis factor 11 [Xylaria intraflava]